jgi:hypothetical protein
VDGVLLCRYAGDHWLEQSEVLTGADAVSATAALDAAPEGPVMSCPAPPIDDPAVLETVDIQSGQDSALLRAGYCPGLYAWHGVLRREITADVLHWVMSPGWSGTLPVGVTGYQPRQ